MRQISRALLVECERAKEALSDRERVEVSVMNPHTAAVLGIELVRSGPEPGSGRVVSFEDLLDRRELFTRINQVVSRAWQSANERGYHEDDLTAVLMVGGSSLIPSVQRALERRYGRERVRRDRPLDAVARGAAAFATGVDFYDHIQHDYAIRWFNRQTGDYEYRTIVSAGTPYPTSKPVETVTVKATHDGQQELGIAIYELSERRRGSGSKATDLARGCEGARTSAGVPRRAGGRYRAGCIDRPHQSSGHRRCLRGLATDTHSGSARGVVDGVQLWHVPSGLPTGKWEGIGVVSCLAVTPNGALLASGSYDGTVRLWRLRSEVARRKPVRDLSSAEVQHLRQSYGALRPVDQAWIELITALVLRRRHDVELLDAPHTAISARRLSRRAVRDRPAGFRLARGRGILF